MRATATTCWGVAVGLGLLLPTAPNFTHSSGQSVPAAANEPLVRVPLDPAATIAVAADATTLFVSSRPSHAHYALTQLLSGGSSTLAALGTLMSAADGPSLTAYAMEDGGRLWTRNAPAGALLRTGDHLFVVSDTAIQAVDPGDGALRWQTPRTSAAEALLAWDAGVLAVAAHSTLTLLRDADGAVLWRADLPAAVKIRPAPAPGLLLAGLANDTLVALDRSTGRQSWTRPLPASGLGVAIMDDRVYLSGADGVLYSQQIDRMDRDRRGWDWFFRLGARSSGAPVVDDEQVYVALYDNTVQAFDRTSGNRAWHQPVSARPMGTPWLAGDRLFVALADGTVTLLDPRSGGRQIAELGSRVDATGAFSVRLESAGPVGIDGRVFTLTTDLSGLRSLSAWTTQSK